MLHNEKNTEKPMYLSSNPTTSLVAMLDPQHFCLQVSKHIGCFPLAQALKQHNQHGCFIVPRTSHLAGFASLPFKLSAMNKNKSDSPTLVALAPCLSRSSSSEIRSRRTQGPASGWEENKSRSSQVLVRLALQKFCVCNHRPKQNDVWKVVGSCLLVGVERDT